MSLLPRKGPRKLCTRLRRYVLHSSCILNLDWLNLQTPHFTAALSTSSIPDSLTRNSTRLEDTWSLLTHLVWNGNNTINLLSQQPHIQVILHAAIQLVERELVFECYFPRPKHRHTMMVNLVLEAASSAEHKEVLQRLEQDQAYMKAFTRVVSFLSILSQPTILMQVVLLISQMGVLG
jgi:hypothetical protein